jgi:hypothetical protein
MLAARGYIPRVVIREKQTAASALGTPAVVGDLQNTGDRTVKMVELTLSYRTPRGTVTGTKKVYPVDARTDAVGYTPPLAPGATTSFVINLDDAPENASSAPDVKVTGVALAD